MKLRHLGLLAVIGTALALPAASQTTQMTPTKPSTTLPVTTAPATAPTAPRPAASASASILDINSASEEDLDRLPGIGKTRATAIIKGRPYRGKDDLLSRHIVPPNVYNGIKDKIIAKQG